VPRAAPRNSALILPIGFAKVRGARVIATGSEHNLDYLRNVKGDNILVEPEGRAVLMDFGSGTWRKREARYEARPGATASSLQAELGGCAPARGMSATRGAAMRERQERGGCSRLEVATGFVCQAPAFCAIITPS